MEIFKNLKFIVATIWADAASNFRKAKLVLWVVGLPFVLWLDNRFAGPAWTEMRMIFIGLPYVIIILFCLLLGFAEKLRKLTHQDITVLFDPDSARYVTPGPLNKALDARRTYIRIYPEVTVADRVRAELLSIEMLEGGEWVSTDFAESASLFWSQSDSAGEVDLGPGSVILLDVFQHEGSIETIVPIVKNPPFRADRMFKVGQTYKFNIAFIDSKQSRTKFSLMAAPGSDGRGVSVTEFPLLPK